MTEGMEDFELTDDEFAETQQAHVPDRLVAAVQAVLQRKDPQGVDPISVAAAEFGWHVAVREHIDAVPQLFAASQIYKLPSAFMSYSQINLYKICGERYRRTYVDRSERQSSSNMAHGKLVHNVVEIMNRHKLAYRELPPPELANDMISTLLAQGIPVDAWDPKVPNLEHLEDSARDLAKIYQEDRLPHTRPKALEIRFVDYINDRVPMQGYIDMVEYSEMDEEWEDATYDPYTPVHFKASDIVTDLKVTGKNYGAHRVVNALQLSLYAGATGARRVQYDLLVETTKTKKFIQHESVRAETEIEHAKDVVEDAAKAISAGIFQRADPESWVCSAKWCQFYSECRERRKGITVTLGMEEHG